MARISILQQAGSLRLITDGNDRYALVETRNGHVYSLQGGTRREGPDTPEGMERVVGEDGWSDRATAERRFADLRDRGEDLSKVIW
ncbi:hypothetical protein [Telmatospirillum sp. J64-1]|uniref:hypothetical protein n=1 Tax=Telmatospirillum sp. J64-1 TaxID=2502183 RepID=UPI00115E1314|nr:hypothetical protein [Telmatospirillum sp. J64-1]